MHDFLRRKFETEFTLDLCVLIFTHMGTNTWTLQVIISVYYVKFK